MTRYRTTEVGPGVASVRISTDGDPYARPDDLPALRDLVAELDGSDVRALLIEGGRHFCAGAERQTLLDPDAADRIGDWVSEAARLLLAIPVPTVAVMAGHALGGGFAFGLWCDRAVLARESLYGAGFVALGFTPGMGATAVLPEVLGPPVARDLLLTGRTLTGAELSDLVPSLSVVPRDEVRERALSLAEDLAGPPIAAVRLLKSVLAEARRERLEVALATERRMHRAIFANPETRAHIAGRMP